MKANKKPQSTDRLSMELKCITSGVLCSRGLFQSNRRTQHIDVGCELKQNRRAQQRQCQSSSEDPARQPETLFFSLRSQLFHPQP